MLKTPFYKYHADHGARFVDFAGWQMPIMYGSILDEHRTVRESAGMFDVSHMGRFKLTGSGARRLLERTLTRRVSDMEPGRCRYSMVCNDQGGVLDDVIVYRFDDHWLLVVNASNREKILGHLQQQTGELKVTIDDRTTSTAMLAIQGPKVIEMIARFSSEVPQLKRYTFCQKSLLVLKMTISRTGYTGEDGVEVILPAAAASTAISMLEREAGKDDNLTLAPAGLGARDTLRLEAGMPLYGHELDEQTDPLTAGLAFAVSLNKDEDERGEPFIGQEALKRIAADGPARRLVGLKIGGRRTPRQGMTVESGDSEIGIVTSGCTSPTLGCPIAMAYIQTEHATTGDTVQINLGTKLIDAEIVKLPFYNPTRK